MLALKGGTAINLFYRDMPRLSVDIDLTYLPVADRAQSLADIEHALKRIAARIRSANPRTTVTESAPATQETINKLVVRTPDLVQVKIEVTPVLRGCVYDAEPRVVSARVEDQFGFAENQVVSFADLYAGKITAALSRQHPRDLFDVHLLLEHEGLTDVLRVGLVVYLISHDHSLHQLLTTPCRDITHDYEQNFRGMAEHDISRETLVATHTKLIQAILSGMPEDHKRFLVSFYRREPEWERLERPGLDRLPSVRWRELNLDRAGKETRDDMVRRLEKVLWA